MTETKHTPGPWKARKGFHADTIEIFHPDKSVKPPFYPCEIATIASDRDTAKAKANARLIAAAPELLEALQAFVKYADDVNDDSPELDRARSAIAKATGGAA